MRPPDNLRIHLAGDVVGDFGQPLISPHLPLDVVLRCPLPTSLLALMGSPGNWHWRPWSVSSFPLSRSLCSLYLSEREGDTKKLWAIRR